MVEGGKEASFDHFCGINSDFFGLVWIWEAYSRWMSMEDLMGRTTILGSDCGGSMEY